MKRKTVPKGENQINQFKQKDISTYMSVFPLQQSRRYMENPINESSYLQHLETSKMIKDPQIVQAVKNMIKLEKINNNAINNNLKAITTKPIISKNPTRPFVEQYPLDENEMLQVCDTKVFVFKNYCNYLLDDEIDLAAGKIQERNQNLQKNINLARAEMLLSEVMGENTYNSRFVSKVIKQEEEILDPKHINYERTELSFYPKEKSRLEMSRVANKDNYNWNGNYDQYPQQSYRP